MLFAAALLGCFNTSCSQVSYYYSIGKHQALLLRSKVDVDQILNQTDIDMKTREYLELSKEVRIFAKENLQLTVADNYSEFVQLPRKYVSYAVNASPKYELKNYLWSFPIVGNLPYKGYPYPEQAKKEAERLKQAGYDVYVRGVTAYSTLGWFSDPILSSMLLYEKHSFVDTLIHESVHATLYIKSEADFNERLASFIGTKGAELFYAQKNNQEAIKALRNEVYDKKIFSAFIKKELADLNQWYQEDLKKLPTEQWDSLKKSRLKSIQEKYKKLDLKGDSTSGFVNRELNNAILQLYSTYNENFDSLEMAYQKLGKKLDRLIALAKEIENEESPEEALYKKVRLN